MPARSWREQARAKQIPPNTDWFAFLMIAGRGFGKTWAASNWLAERAATNPGSHCVIVAPTWRDARHVCVEGNSGILRALSDAGEYYEYAAGLKVELPNGSTITSFTGDATPSALREHLAGTNVESVWFDELSAIPGALALWDDVFIPLMSVSTAKDSDPRIYLTTAPDYERPCPLLTKLLLEGDQGGVVRVDGETWVNPAGAMRDGKASARLGDGSRRSGRTITVAD